MRESERFHLTKWMEDQEEINIELLALIATLTRRVEALEKMHEEG